MHQEHSLKTSDRNTGIRVLIFFVCTIASAFGGFNGGLLLFVLWVDCFSPAATHESPCAFGGAPLLLTFALYLFAWTVYYIMAAAWIGRATLPRWLPIAGTLAAFGFFIPQTMIMVGSPFGGFQRLLVIAMQLVIVSPAVLLAIFLVLHHLRQSKKLDA